VTQLETRGQPISHLCARWIRTYHRRLKTQYISGHGVAATYGKVYSAAREYYLDDRAGNEPEIIAAVDTLAKTFTHALVSSSTARLEPYWATLGAFELADPSMELPAADDAGTAVWDAAKDLCATAGVNFDAFRVQTTELHSAFPDMGGELKMDCTKNLLRFYHNLARQGWLATRPAVRDYAVAVFTFPVTTVFIECLFSGMKLNKSTTRSSMVDDKCVAVLKARELKPVLTSNDSAPEPPLTLGTQSALEHDIFDPT
jgi:hypothetical protein